MVNPIYLSLSLNLMPFITTSAWERVKPCLSNACNNWYVSKWCVGGSGVSFIPSYELLSLLLLRNEEWEEGSSTWDSFCVIGTGTGKANSSLLLGWVGRVGNGEGKGRDVSSVPIHCFRILLAISGLCVGRRAVAADILANMWMWKKEPYHHLPPLSYFPPWCITLAHYYIIHPYPMSTWLVWSYNQYQYYSIH